jgi:hypothetical protein
MPITLICQPGDALQVRLVCRGRTEVAADMGSLATTVAK